MSKEQLCRCNNCSTIMFDENPSEQPFLEAPEGTLSMKRVQDAEGGVFWACPVCEDDGYLVDITSQEMLEKSLAEPTFFDIHDDVTNKTLKIKAYSLEQAEGIADTTPFEDYDDGDEIDVLEDIENYNSLPNSDS